MPEYLYRCSLHGVFSRPFPMGTAVERTLCPACGEQARRRYAAVPIKFVGPGFSTSGKFDRPDERIKAEVKASQDIDVTTGLTWEETDNRLAERKAHWGHRIRKDVHLSDQAMTNDVK